jgi:hypothetical protein
MTVMRMLMMVMPVAVMHMTAGLVGKPGLFGSLGNLTLDSTETDGDCTYSHF